MARVLPWRRKFLRTPSGSAYPTVPPKSAQSASVYAAAACTWDGGVACASDGWPSVESRPHTACAALGAPKVAAEAEMPSAEISAEIGDDRPASPSSMRVRLYLPVPPPHLESAPASAPAPSTGHGGGWEEAYAPADAWVAVPEPATTWPHESAPPRGVRCHAAGALQRELDAAGGPLGARLQRLEAAAANAWYMPNAPPPRPASGWAGQRWVIHNTY